MEEYCEAALREGVTMLCFTDHIECDPLSRYFTYDTFDFAAYRNAFETCRQTYEAQGLQLLFGYEFGEPHRHPKEFEKVLATRPDFVLASVHRAYDLYKNGGQLTPEALWEMQYDETLRMVRFGGFDALAHLDFPKKKGLPFLYDATAVAEILQTVVAQGICLELNTSSLLSMNETAPSLQTAELYRDFGGKNVTISSDSHSFQTLAFRFTETLEALPHGLTAGYFRQRKFFALNEPTE